jgi:3-hydroxybutyryl-CoA dehydrogenase
VGETNQKQLDKDTIVGVLGAGSMGTGIAQIAATNKHQVVLVDLNPEALTKAKASLTKILARLVEKEKINEVTAKEILGRINFSSNNKNFKDCGIVIEAIIEKIALKKTIFTELENIVSETCILASNTSSLSIASIASACKKADRVIGIHFF